MELMHVENEDSQFSRLKIHISFEISRRFGTPPSTDKRSPAGTHLEQPVPPLHLIREPPTLVRRRVRLNVTSGISPSNYSPSGDKQ